MDPQTVGAVLAFAGLLLTQALLHQRWSREQDAKREAFATKAAEQRKEEAREQAEVRRQEQREILERMERQNNAVVENAVKLAEAHQEDAEKARLLALENAQAHATCRQEVATLTGKVDELRARIIEFERTSGRESLISQRHQDLKHKTLTALTASEGITGLVVKCASGCTCHAFDPVAALLDTYHPRLDELLEENRMSLDEWLSQRET